MHTFTGKYHPAHFVFRSVDKKVLQKKRKRKKVLKRQFRGFAQCLMRLSMNCIPFFSKKVIQRRKKNENTEYLPFRVDLNPKLSVNNFGAARDPEV